MNNFEQQLAKRLKQDASAYREWSARRVAASYGVSDGQAMWNRPKRRFWLPAALAASVVMATVVWLSYPAKQRKAMMDVSTVTAQWQQLPEKIEQATQSPLAQEQQAIKADLKSLKERFLSI